MNKEPNHEIVEINRKAAKVGLSYGQFVAKTYEARHMTVRKSSKKGKDGNKNA